MEADSKLQPRSGISPDDAENGVDLSAIRRLLKLSPVERLRLAVEEARNLQLFEARLRRE